MYRTHFGLREMPFGITPDTNFAYACNTHQEALNTLLVAVKNGEGFIKITGEVGTGKPCCAAGSSPRSTRTTSPPISPTPISSRGRSCSRWPKNSGWHCRRRWISTIC